MGSRVKEDERIERTIRSLLKLPENRRCINCNSLGPQYVCATFWTFVCTNCSGIHREFTHRVKSISMAKFTTEEVSELRAGGNERAKQLFFKEWDVQRDVYPDGSNIFKLREFIKSVYVDKRYSSKSNGKINMHKLAVIEDSKESKNGSANVFRSRSSHSVEISERSNSGSSKAFGRNVNEPLKFYFDEKKNKHGGHNSRSRGLPKSPIRFEIVDDRFRDDGSVKKYDGHSLPSRDSRRYTKSLDLSNNKETPNSPIVRHASEVLGDNAPRLLGNVVEKQKDTNEETMHNKMMTASSSKKTLEEKMENLGSLIDDAGVSELSHPKSTTDRQHIPISKNNNSMTTNELSTSLKTVEGPTPNSLEELLFGLIVPSNGAKINNSQLWSQSDISSTTFANNYSTTNPGPQMMPSTPADKATSFVTSPTIAHVHSSTTSSSAPELHTFFPDNIEIKVDTKGIDAPSVTPSIQVTTLDISSSAHGECHGVGSELHQNETNSNARKELPEDLFTGGFSFASSQVHNWQTGQHHGMGYGMQYYQYPMAMGTFTYTTKPTNPFDLSCDDTSQNQAPQYHPSMECMQGDLTHMSVSGGYSDSSSLAGDSIGLIASQSPFYGAALSPSSPFPALNLYPGAYMGQQSHVNMSTTLGRQGIYDLATERNNFHQANNGYPSTNPNAYISRGNPFG